MLLFVVVVVTLQRAAATLAAVSGGGGTESTPLLRAKQPLCGDSLTFVGGDGFSMVNIKGTCRLWSVGQSYRE